MFTREHEVVRWYTNIPQDPDGIPSYVLDVEFASIRYWRNPTVLGSVLKCFSRVEVLTFSDTWVPSSEVNDIISSGEFGRELTSLVLIYARSALPALRSLILSFPNLRELTIHDIMQEVEPPALLFPEQPWQREPLRSLELYWFLDDEIEFIVRCGITSRRVDLSVTGVMVEKIIARSSETMRELVLWGAWLLWNFVAREWR